MSRPYPAQRVTFSSGLDLSPPIKPDPHPLQHQPLDSSSSSGSNSYRSVSASTTSTGNTSEHAPFAIKGSNGAAALLQQHQANQDAFRATSQHHAFVYQNQRGALGEPQIGLEPASRESSASSQGAGAGGKDADYDPFRIKHRRRTSPSQLKVLEYHFDVNPKPDVTVRKALSEQLNMTPREVQVWFQNRRAKIKKLKERSDRAPTTSSRDGDSPPSAPKSPPYPNGGAELPTPPSIYSPAQSHHSSSSYGPDSVPHSRLTPPGAPYSSLPYGTTPQHRGGPSLHSHLSVHHAPVDQLPLTAYGPQASYQSTVFTTTVASSAYATNDYLPLSTSVPGGLPFPIMAQDSFAAARRFSMPAFGSEQPNGWANGQPEHPPTSSDGFPPYQPPYTTAFASSALSADAPQQPPITTAHPASYPAYSSYTTASAPAVHDRRQSFVSDSHLYESSSQAPHAYSLGSSLQASATHDSGSPNGYLPPHDPMAPLDPFTSFDPLGPIPSSVSNDDLSYVATSGGARHAERRPSVQYRQGHRLKPYDQNERRSPTSHSPID
ncbi:homeobox domain-containing protein [Sporobolomyces koalae]|uniref:homeobox domain-containing protein n=1 Tax=Sporobolomyces koalae TaxID=500713 RepID=UPI00317EF2A3